MISNFESVFPSPNVLNALRKRLQPGQKAYLVGGVVRDALLGLENHDLDFVVSVSADLDELGDIFEGCEMLD